MDSIIFRETTVTNSCLALISKLKQTKKQKKNKTTAHDGAVTMF